MNFPSWGGGGGVLSRGMGVLSREGGMVWVSCPGGVGVLSRGGGGGPIWGGGGGPDLGGGDVHLPPWPCDLSHDASGVTSPHPPILPNDRRL